MDSTKNTRRWRLPQRKVLSFLNRLRTAGIVSTKIHAPKGEDEGVVHITTEVGDQKLRELHTPKYAQQIV